MVSYVGSLLAPISASSDIPLRLLYLTRHIMTIMRIANPTEQDPITGPMMILISCCVWLQLEQIPSESGCKIIVIIIII